MAERGTHKNLNAAKQQQQQYFSICLSSYLSYLPFNSRLIMTISISRIYSNSSHSSKHYVNGGNVAQNNSNINNNKKSSAVETRSMAWEQVISSVGTMVTVSYQHDQLAVPLATLRVLRIYLENRKESAWNQPPSHMPSHILLHQGNNAALSMFDDAVNTDDKGGGMSHDTINDSGLMTTLHFDPEAGDAIYSPTSLTPVTFQHNRYAIFQDDDDDDDDDSLPGVVDREDSNKNGVDSAAMAGVMTMRRLLIRILTSLSEGHAKSAHLLCETKGNHRHQQHEWSKGTESIALAFECLTAALNMADEEFARLLALHQKFHHQQQMQVATGRYTDDDYHDDDAASLLTQPTSSDNSDNSNNLFGTKGKQIALWMQQLADDAAIVLHAMDHHVKERTKYSKEVARRSRILKKRLQPQWESRDKAKRRVGTDSWENNPDAKHAYAKQRAADEREYKAIMKTKIRLQAMDTNQVYNRLRAIYDKVKNNNHRTGNLSMAQRSGDNRSRNKTQKNNGNSKGRRNRGGQCRRGGDRRRSTEGQNDLY